MSKRNLFLCFDAFGTLFKPAEPVAKQYADVARQFGLRVNDAQVTATFREAFKREAKVHPNYGKATGMGAQTWWTNVIRNTLRPLVGPDQTIPDGLAPRLQHRFASNEGYICVPQLPSLLQALKEPHPKKGFDKVVVGVITNSDDRVPDILASFGVRVSPLRYGTPIDRAKLAGAVYDIDLHCMSYDVGYEKPDKRVFSAAEELLREVTNQDATSSADAGASSWDKIYLGDDYNKDVLGALDSGWYALFLEGQKQPPRSMPLLVDQKGGSVSEAFTQHQALSVDSVQTAIGWLLGQR